MRRSDEHLTTGPVAVAPFERLRNTCVCDWRCSAGREAPCRPARPARSPSRVSSRTRMMCMHTLRQVACGRCVWYLRSSASQPCMQGAWSEELPVQKGSWATGRPAGCCGPLGGWRGGWCLLNLKRPAGGVPINMLLQVYKELSPRFQQLLASCGLYMNSLMRCGHGRNHLGTMVGSPSMLLGPPIGEVKRMQAAPFGSPQKHGGSSKKTSDSVSRVL